MIYGVLPDEPTTEGREHWYLVCAKDEKEAALNGPFFDPRDADAELREVERRIANGEKTICDRHHFLVRGPVPLARFRITQPLVYSGSLNEDVPVPQRWWERWAYLGGEWDLAVQAKTRSGIG